MNTRGGHHQNGTSILASGCTRYTLLVLVRTRPIQEQSQSWTGHKLGSSRRQSPACDAAEKRSLLWEYVPRMYPVITEVPVLPHPPSDGSVVWHCADNNPIHVYPDLVFRPACLVLSCPVLIEVGGLEGCRYSCCCCCCRRQPPTALCACFSTDCNIAVSRVASILQPTATTWPLLSPAPVHFPHPTLFCRFSRYRSCYLRSFVRKREAERELRCRCSSPFATRLQSKYHV